MSNSLFGRVYFGGMGEQKEIERYVAPDGRELTPMQSAFVHHLVVKNCTPADAAKAAGYKNPASQLAQIHGNPAVSAVIYREIQIAICNDAVAARGVIREIMEDKTAPKGIRLDAAKTILNRAGHVEQKPKELDKNIRDVADLPAGDLEEMIKNLQDQLQDKRAVPGDTAPPGALPSPPTPIKSNT